MGESVRAVSVAACVAEYVAMALFVVFGCGSAMGIAGSTKDSSGEGGTTSVIPGWVLMVALVFGLTITTLVYSIGHYSGGHINCAVTFGLVLAGECAVLQGLANFVAQMLGSITGAAILFAIFPAENDQTANLATNSVGKAWGWENALVGEIVGTFLLMFVVLQTACNPKSVANRAQASLAIGIAVFAAHALLIPIDGCSINPTRSFGPAVLATARFSSEDLGAAIAPTLPPSTLDSGVTLPPQPAVVAKAHPFTGMWIFWVGPLIGAALAVGVSKLMQKIPAGEVKQEAVEEEVSDFPLQQA